MPKVKFKTRVLDKATGVTHEPSDSFVDVSEQFAERIREIQKDERHKDSFEFAKGRPVKEDKADD